MGLTKSILILTVLHCLSCRGYTHNYYRRDSRKPKMPNFSDEQILDTYSNRLNSPAVSKFQKNEAKYPMNNFVVKTNSSSKNNGENVAMNLNIPSAISGYLLEEIDLKYTKKTQKKARGNEVDNLMIKYFTNKSSNLHLSSVKKGNEVRTNYLAGDKYRWNEPPASNTRQENHRPFMYKQKYPLRLANQIRSNPYRRGKSFTLNIDEPNDLMSNDKNERDAFKQFNGFDSVNLNIPKYDEYTTEKEESVDNLFEFFKNLGDSENSKI